MTRRCFSELGDHLEIRFSRQIDASSVVQTMIRKLKIKITYLKVSKISSFYV